MEGGLGLLVLGPTQYGGGVATDLLTDSREDNADAVEASCNC
jgi:hypothetical protein